MCVCVCVWGGVHLRCWCDLMFLGFWGFFLGHSHVFRPELAARGIAGQLQFLAGRDELRPILAVLHVVASRRPTQGDGVCGHGAELSGGGVTW